MPLFRKAYTSAPLQQAVSVNRVAYPVAGVMQCSILQAGSFWKDALTYIPKGVHICELFTS